MPKQAVEPKSRKTASHMQRNGYIERMRKHLAKEKKENGLLDIRFCAVPAKGASSLTADGLARAYCEVFGC